MTRTCFLVILAVLSINAEAQVNSNTGASPSGRQIQDQLRLPPDGLSPPRRPYVEEADFWKNFRENIHGGYSLSYMGPRLMGNGTDTYNVFLADVAPVQFFHGGNLSYHVNDDLDVGIRFAAIQNLTDEVNGRNGATYDTDVVAFDPWIFFGLPRWIKVPGWGVSTTIALGIPITQASRDIGRIGEIELTQTWSLNLKSKWSFSLNGLINPRFYSDPLPNGFSDRQIFLGSFGHNLGYQVSPTFGLMTSTNFTYEKRDPDLSGRFLGTNIPDTFRISASITPKLERIFVSVGGYFQFILTNPSSETAIIGGNFSVGF